jgi:hypothetical protein
VVTLPPEGDTLGAEAELDRGLVQPGEVAAALDAGALEQVVEPGIGLEHGEREGREEIAVGAGGHLDDRVRRGLGAGGGGRRVERGDPRRYRRCRDAGMGCGAAVRAENGEQGVGQ